MAADAELVEGDDTLQPAFLGVADLLGVTPGKLGEVAPGAGALVGLPAFEGVEQGVAGEGAGRGLGVESFRREVELGEREAALTEILPGLEVGVGFGQAEAAAQLGR